MFQGQNPDNMWKIPGAIYT